MLAVYVTTGDDHQPVDPWVLIMTAEDNTVPTNALSVRDPAYKVVVRVHTWALIDYGAQLTLVRSQMLSRIKEKYGWSIKECHTCNRPLEQQPVRATGEPLGADL